MLALLTASLSNSQFYVGFRDGCNILSNPTKMVDYNTYVNDPTATVLGMQIGACALRVASCIALPGSGVAGASFVFGASSGCVPLGLSAADGMSIYNFGTPAACTAYFNTVTALGPTPTLAAITAASPAYAAVLAAPVDVQTDTASNGVANACGASSNLLPRCQPYVAPSGQYQIVAVKTSAVATETCSATPTTPAPAPAPTPTADIFVGYRDGCNVASNPTKVLSLSTAFPQLTSFDDQQVGTCVNRISNCYSHPSSGAIGIILGHSGCQSLGYARNGGMDIYSFATLAQCTPFKQASRQVNDVASLQTFLATYGAVISAPAVSDADGVNACSSTSTAYLPPSLHSCLAPSGQFQVCACACDCVCVCARA